MSMTNILEILRQNADAKGIPTLSKQQWKDLNAAHGKEVIITALIDYIHTEKPEPPVCNITHQDMVNCFHKLKSADHMKFFLEHDDVKDRVMEKYEDYGKPYKEHGLGIVQMGNSYIDVSNYFNQTPRMECDVYGFKSAHYRWRNCEDLRTVFLALWRLGNDHLSEYAFVVAFRLATYIATQFKPHVAKFIYDAPKAKVVFDSSCGWGDRLAGFFCSNAEAYYGCDPNDQMFEIYKKQCAEYFKLLGETYTLDEETDHFVAEGKTKRVVIWRSPAEDLDYRMLPKIDVAFTSPPYFSTELYNSNGIHADEQSWARYNEYELWRDNFYLPVNRKTFERLRDGGLLIVNIQDPKIKNKRYYASDDLINEMTTKYTECNFIGQLGMRIMQRPKNIAKDKLSKHFKGIYTEPMWVFGKNRTHFLERNEGLLNFM